MAKRGSGNSQQLVFSLNFICMGRELLVGFYKLGFAKEMLRGEIVRVSVLTSL